MGSKGLPVYIHRTSQCDAGGLVREAGIEARAQVWNPTTERCFMNCRWWKQNVSCLTTLWSFFLLFFANVRSLLTILMHASFKHSKKSCNNEGGQEMWLLLSRGLHTLPLAHHGGLHLDQQVEADFGGISSWEDVLDDCLDASIQPLRFCCGAGEDAEDGEVDH